MVVGVMVVGAIAIFAGAVLYVRGLLWCGKLAPALRTLVGILLWLPFALLTVLPLFVAMPHAFCGSCGHRWFSLAWLLIWYIAAVVPGFLHIRSRLSALRLAGFFRNPT
jgi:hypothetical protein